MSSNNSGGGSFPLPADGDFDWSAMMGNIAPPEWELLLSASAKNELDNVKDMVENQGVPVSHCNGVGQTALHVAALWGHIEVARYLIEAGANVDAANRIAGATPLHSTLQSAHRITADQQLAMVNLLLDVGKADPKVEDRFGKTPAEYMERDHPYRDTLMKRIAPPPKGVDRFRAGFLRSVMNDMPSCSKAT